METIKIGDPDAVVKAAVVLRAGGVILYPTDTLYGLGVDALSDDAVAKVRELKGRDARKPIHAIVADMEMASKYGEVHEVALALARAYLPGPLSLILKKKPEIETGIAQGIDTFCIRIPVNRFCMNLARAFGKPYTTTSANQSGEVPARTVEGILAQLGDSASLIDLVIDAGELPERSPSTIVDVSSGKIEVVREGAIPSAEILGES